MPLSSTSKTMNKVALLPHYKSITNALMQADPTKTTTLRKQFVSKISRKFEELASIIRKAIVDDDCFGLKDDEIETMALATPGRKAFAFKRSGDKISAFMKWLEEQEEQGILEVTRGVQRLGGSIEEAWTDVYIRSAYQKGRAQALGKLKKAGYDTEGMLEEQTFQAGFYQPFHADRVGVLYTRTFSELKGITRAMDQQISRVLAEGMAKGENPIRMAKQLNKVITGRGDGATLGITDSLGRYIPAKRRAQTLARTEVIRAHHQAHIQEYKIAGALGITIVAEWSTAGDSRVCPICAELEGRRFTPEEVIDLIPRHPNCRCTTMPVPLDAVQPQKQIVPSIPFRAKSIREFIKDDEKFVYGFGDDIGVGLDYDKTTPTITISAEEGKAIKDYTISGYAHINPVLRGELEEFPSGMVEIEKNLEKGLSKLPKHDGVSMRGFCFTKDGEYEAFMNNIKETNGFFDLAYVSTTTSEIVARSFVGGGLREGSVFMIIRGKNGRYVYSYSGNKEEMEVLFNKGTEFLVKRIEEIPGKRQAIVWLEEV